MSLLIKENHVTPFLIDVLEQINVEGIEPTLPPLWSSLSLITPYIESNNSVRMC